MVGAGGQFQGLSAIPFLEDLITSGIPFDTSPEFEAVQRLQRDNTRIASEALLQRFGGTGARFGTDVIDSIEELERERALDLDVFNTGVAREEFGATQGRRLSGVALAQALSEFGISSTQDAARTLVGQTVPSRAPGLFETLLTAGVTAGVGGVTGGLGQRGFLGEDFGPG